MPKLKTKPSPPPHAFIKLLSRNLLIGLIIITISLCLGMLGYRHFENMDWVDAYKNAAMILAVWDLLTL